MGVKAFDSQMGAAMGSYDFPGGFAVDLTFDADPTPLGGNLYVTDSWAPRILRLRAGGSALDEWVNDPQLGIVEVSLD